MSIVIPSNEHFLTIDRLRGLGSSHYRIGKLTNKGACKSKQEYV